MLAMTVLMGSCFSFHKDSKWHFDDNGRCLKLTPESVLHPVLACERSNTYDFTFGSNKKRYNKEVFRQELSDQIRQFIRTSSYPLGALQQADLEVWVKAPVFNPVAAELMVVVLAKAGNFVVRLPVDMTEWHIASANTFLLGKDPYPVKILRQVGTIALRSQGHIPKTKFRAFLADNGLGTDDRATWPFLTLTTPPFAEAKTLFTLWLHPEAEDVLELADYVLAAESDGMKQRFIRFSFKDVK